MNINEVRSIDASKEETSFISKGDSYLAVWINQFQRVDQHHIGQHNRLRDIMIEVFLIFQLYIFHGYGENPIHSTMKY